MAVDAAGTAEYKLFEYYELAYGYQFHSTFLRIAERFGAKIENLDYGENVTATFAVLCGDSKKLCDEIFEVSNGTLTCTYIKNGFLGG